MRAWVLTVDDLLARHPLDEVKEGGLYKFVKVGGVYRFAEVDFSCPKHSDLVQEGEVGESAGNIRVTMEYWAMTQWYSTTLKLQATVEDEEALTRSLRRSVRG